MRIHTLTLLATAASAMLFASLAQASDTEAVFRVPNPKWKAECGSCHIAYPVRLLPAESWRAIMAGLDKHFGSDASLDAATATEITAFLEKNANASRSKIEPATKPQLRITETSWFKREHDEVSAATWKNPQVKSAANCGACHTLADRGEFNEHGLRIPKT